MGKPRNDLILDTDFMENDLTIPLELTVGQKLAGSYLLKSRLSDGGSGAIWLADDAVSGKEVSLHFIPQAIVGDGVVMKRIRQEVKRTQQLIHPNILRVYDLVEEKGWAAVSMEPNGSLPASHELKGRVASRAPLARRRWAPTLSKER